MVIKAPMISPRSSATGYALAVLSIAIGAGSLILFAVFLYLGPFRLADLGFDLIEALAFNAFLCAVFFLQHSGMIRKATRRRMSRVVSERFLGAVFSIASGATLLILVLLWQETGLIFAAADGVYRWVLRAVFFVSVAVQAWGIWALKSADLFGTDSALRPAGPAPPAAPTPMVVRGPYRWVRHPLYLTTLLMIWSYPELTADRLLFNCLFTGWIFLGSVLEERDLVAAYGEAYRNYQRRVPMLIPYRTPFC